MHVACFVKTLIVTLSKEIDKKKISSCLYQLKFRCMFHVLLKYLLLFYFKKLIRINKLLSLSTETQMHVACFVKTLIIILSKKIDKNKKVIVSI